MTKSISIIIPLKNRTSIIVNYCPIPIKHLDRHKLILSNCSKEKIDIVSHNENGTQIRIQLLLNCLNSLSKIKLPEETFEVILVDFNSDDYNLQILQKKYSNLKLKIIPVDDYFSRGKGLNIGLKHATQDYIFFCDADMLFTGRQIFDNGYLETKKDKIFFPICFHLSEPSHQLGFWRKSGYGLSFMKKDFFLKQNYKLSEYDALGNEDDDIWNFFNKKDLCVRYEVKNYYHQWHPDSMEFKNRYYKNSDILKKKIFINLIPEHYQQCNKYIKSQLKNIIKEKDYYLVHKLEKFTDIVVQIPNSEFITLLDNSEIDEYKKKFNKNIQIINLKSKPEVVLTEEIKQEIMDEIQIDKKDDSSVNTKDEFIVT